MGIAVQKFTFNPFQENTYVVHDGKVCVIIDPGCHTHEEHNELVRFIEDEHLTPVALLLTHAHIDHVLGCDFVLKKYNIDFYVHEEGLSVLHSVPNYAHVYGFLGYVPPSEPNKFFEDGELLSFGKLNFEVRYAPGHAPGHVVFYNSDRNFVINGDVLFAGSFGRVDLPGGDMDLLKHSIEEKLFTLPEETIVYCGHGPETTIGREKVSNYILQF